MNTLKYTIIKTEKQYNKYCNTLEYLLVEGDKTLTDEIESLTQLIEKWDRENNSFDELTPVELLKSLMEENNLKAVDLSRILNLSEGTVSKILNCRKGLSKKSIRRLSDHFKVSQKAFICPAN